MHNAFVAKVDWPIVGTKPIKVLFNQFFASRLKYPGPSPQRSVSLPASGETLAALTLAAFALTCLAPAAAAADLGISGVGAVGGLHIPSAYTLKDGELALSAGNEQDPRLGNFSVKQNYSLGFGLLPGVEIFGRLANYQNPPPPNYWGWNIGGPRDISANIKWQLPLKIQGLPKLAIGATDLSGGAVFFQSYYAVASDEAGPVRWSLGYARAGDSAAPPLSGLFGGAEVRLGSTRATALLETDGYQRYAGLRYYSEPLPWLGEAQVIGSLQTSLGGSLPASPSADKPSVNLSLVLPMGHTDRTRQARWAATAKPMLALPNLPEAAQTDSAPTPAEDAAAMDQLGKLARALRSQGLDRISVGTLASQLVVQFENNRYLQNEADALGIVLGLAAELAPKQLKQVVAISLKSGQAMSQTTVDVWGMRRFLRSGNTADVSPSFQFQRSRSVDVSVVRWLADDYGSAKTRLLVSVSPLLNYTLGTEYGSFDYSLAMQARLSASPWRGAQVYADVVKAIDNSNSFEKPMIFSSSLHESGLKTLAFQQSIWIGSNLFGSIGGGRFNYNRDDGIEGQAIYFLPWRGDSVRYSGSSMRHRANVRPKFEQAMAATYRWAWSPDTWLEAGYQRYTDNSAGPAFTFRRWFGDVEVRIFSRTGGHNTFVGLSVALPLSPRKGLSAGPVQLNGSGRFAQGLRTRMSNAHDRRNFVDASAVKSVTLSFDPEVELLNSGRLSTDVVLSHLQRMRESFYMFARSEVF